MAKSIKVPKKKAQETKNRLLDSGSLDRNFKPETTDEFVYFPVKGEVEGFELVERKLLKLKKKPNSLTEALEGILEPGEIEKVVTSFDLLGELAIVEIPEKLEKKKNEIGKAVMDVHRSVRTVAMKKGPMEGEFRVRKLEVIAGENKTETTYRESGCMLLLDPAKVYFSPRLSFERERIAGLVKDGERVLVMFAGVGPFPIVIAKKKPGAVVAAIELNPAAFGYMVGNIKKNKLEEKITPVFGDVREVVPELFRNWADRVLMPLPKGAEEFLDTALVAAKFGAVIHVYTFTRAGEEEKKAEEVVAKIKELGRKAELLSFRTVRPFAPHVDQISVDILAL
ncbi:MAG: class I SAM-dependent methyltransferase family protein [Candidatus Micrarchaeota archaeon]